MTNKQTSEISSNIVKKNNNNIMTIRDLIFAKDLGFNLFLSETEGYKINIASLVGM